jgi:hypothetical protein
MCELTINEPPEWPMCKVCPKCKMLQIRALSKSHSLIGWKQNNDWLKTNKDWLKTKHWLVENITLIGWKQSVDWLKTKHWFIENITLIGWKQITEWLKIDHLLVENKVMIGWSQSAGENSHHFTHIADAASSRWIKTCQILHFAFPTERKKQRQTITLYIAVYSCAVASLLAASASAIALI